jgi:glycosyltransferase involved in cell wall biosynthesis
MNTKQGLPLSLVITSYTTERLNDIYELLDSIKHQTFKNIEVIFVAERTMELYEKVEAHARDNGISNFKAVFNDGEPGQSPARNLGIKHAKGDIIAFVDDDVVLFNDWASEMVYTYQDDATIGATGPAFPLWENESLKWLPIEFYWIVSCTAFAGLNELTSVRCAGGMNMSFRKEAFKYCHFSENFGHIAQEKSKVGPVVDDAEFSINLRLKTGKQILFNPTVRVKHRVYAYRLGKKFIRGQSYWQGYSKALLKKTYPADSDTRGLLRERALLGRILFGLVPRTAVLLFRSPKKAARIFALTTAVLFYVALGYSAGAFPKLMGFTKKYYQS